MREHAIKLMYIAVIVCVVSTPTAVLPQQIGKAAPSNTRLIISLELGSVNVWLGERETDTLLQLQGAGYQLIGESSDKTKMIKDGKNYYTAAFTNGILVYAERDWYNENTDEMSAVLGALSALAEHGATSCTITKAPLSKPDETIDRIFIECGQRSLLLMKGHFGSATNGFVDAYERIGEAP